MNLERPVCDLRTVDWSPTREAGLDRLKAFVPESGRDYARRRNFDLGAADRSNVSALSPWIRRRMITEEEVIAAVLKHHDFAAAEKFIQEVFWRTYWKGWLEMRPGVWRRYEQDLTALTAAWRDNSDIRTAQAGETGIDAFDQWACELVQTGWLHNHARMWFASIWIFTLRLPWQLGARFFYDHLLDADPASNTLSWRWVAGLHTRGKHYLARASNIRDNTIGRFDPQGLLSESALAISEDEALPPVAIPPSGSKPSPGPVAALLTEEDLHPESWLMDAEVVACAALALPSPSEDDGPAAQFSRGALGDALTRAQAWCGAEGQTVSAPDVIGWAQATGVKQIVTGYAPVGRIAGCLDEIEAALLVQGQRLVRLQRKWDSRAWPHAGAGFFKMKAQIPHLLTSASIA